MNANQSSSNIVQLDTQEEQRVSRGFWRDAWRRLRRNKLALIGLSVILLNIFSAIFAPVIAPGSFSTQVLSENNSSPLWVTKVFPTMRPLDQDEWHFTAQAGEVVSIVVRSEEFDTRFSLYNAKNAVVKVGEKRVASFGQPSDLSSYLQNFTLKDGGEYRLLVERADLSQKGSYTLSLLLGNPDLTTLPDPSTRCAEDGEGIRACGTLTMDSTVTNSLMGNGYVTISDRYILGSDNLGRDLLTRIIYGARISLAVAFVGPLVSLAVGMVLGLISGYIGGQTDNLLMRAVDIMYAFPTILFIILMMAYFRAAGGDADPDSLVGRLNKIDAHFGGMLFIFIGIGLTSWMQATRLTRAQVLSVRSKEYIEAAVSIGTPTSMVIFRHVLPNILGPIIVAETLTIPAYISYEAFLSFIGLGVNPPTPSWGAMISDGSSAISSYPNQAIFPALALFFIMFAFNFLGDGLRDALDPRSR